MASFVERLNPVPKYVATRTLTGPLAWNASLILGDLEQDISNMKAEHRGNLVVSGCGELARSPELVASTPYRSEVVCLCYRSATA